MSPRSGPYVRRPERAAELRSLGLEPVLADVLDPGSLAALPAVSALVYCVGFDRAAGPSLRTVYVSGLLHFLLPPPASSPNRAAGAAREAGDQQLR